MTLSLPYTAGFLAMACAAGLMAAAPTAQGQVSVNQPVSAVAPPMAVESPASAPAVIAQNQELESRAVRRNEGTSGFPGLTTQGRSNSVTFLWLQTAVVLGILLGAMWLVLRWLRKRGIGGSFGGERSAIQVLTRGYLTGKHQVVLVRFGGRVLLLGVGPQGVNVLSEMTNPEEAAQVLAQLQGARVGSASQDFQQAIAEAAQEYNPDEAVAAQAGPVVHTPSRDQIGVIRSEIRGLLAKMQSVGQSRKTD